MISLISTIRIYILHARLHTARLGCIHRVADIVLAELALLASDTLAVHIAKALREDGGEHITDVRQEHKERHNNDQQDTYR